MDACNGRGGIVRVGVVRLSAMTQGRSYTLVFENSWATTISEVMSSIKGNTILLSLRIRRIKTGEAPGIEIVIQLICILV